METGTDRTGAFYRIVISIQTIIVTPFVPFVCYDIQLTKLNKEVNKEKNIRPHMKAYKSRLPQCWNTLCMGPNNTPKSL